MNQCFRCSHTSQYFSAKGTFTINEPVAVNTQQIPNTIVIGWIKIDLILIFAARNPVIVEAITRVLINGVLNQSPLSKTPVTVNKLKVSSRSVIQLWPGITLWNIATLNPTLSSSSYCPLISSDILLLLIYPHFPLNMRFWEVFAKGSLIGYYVRAYSYFREFGHLFLELQLVCLWSGISYDNRCVYFSIGEINESRDPF